MSVQRSLVVILEFVKDLLGHLSKRSLVPPWPLLWGGDRGGLFEVRVLLEVLLGLIGADTERKNARMRRSQPKGGLYSCSGRCNDWTLKPPQNQATRATRNCPSNRCPTGGSATKV